MPRVDRISTIEYCIVSPPAVADKQAYLPAHPAAFQVFQNIFLTIQKYKKTLNNQPVADVLKTMASILQDLILRWIVDLLLFLFIFLIFSVKIFD